MDPQRENPAPLASAPPLSTVERVVLFADMESYSRRIGEDEAATLEFMTGCFDTMRILSRRYNGTLVKTLGDGAMLLFDDPIDAIDYGVEFQRVVTKIQLETPNPYAFRVGLHKGDVLLRNGDAYGNTVNVAARLQSIAAPGQCVVSKIVYDAANTRSGLRFEALGAPSLKNIRERVPVYRVVDPLLQGQAPASSTVPQVEVLKGEIMPNAHDLNFDARLLLGYLALCPGHADSLERLATLFGGKDAAERVSAAIADLDGDDATRALLLTRYQGLLALDPVSVETDLDALLREVRRGSVPELLTTDAHWPQRILSGLDGAGSVFEGWRKVTRATWKRRMMQAMERLLERTVPVEDAHEDAADAMLLLEPGNEVAAEARIVARIARGNRSGALDEFERLENYLADTYGISPGARIRTAIQSLMKRGGRTVVDPVPPAPRRPRRLLRIAIAEFEDAAGTSTERLSAFRDDIIANLARFRDWSVIDLVSVDEDQADLDYRIEGATTPHLGWPTLTLRLSDHIGGRAIWAEHFSLASDTWERTQREIIRQISATIEGYISADRFAAELGDANRNPTCHDAWLRGDRAMMRWTPEGAEEARDIFKNILINNPDHAPSLTSLASLSNIRHLIWPGSAPSSAEVTEADRLASYAAEIDPMDSRLQRVVAWSAAMSGAFARATMHMDLAAGLNPNSPTTLASCAMGFAWFGEHEKAEATLTRCHSISSMLPQWGWAYNASTLFFLDRLDQALEAAELGGNSIADTQGWIAAIHARRGENQKAKIAFECLYHSVSTIWAGESEASAEAVANWFATAFPIRNETDRFRLTEAIHTARTA